MKTTETIPSNCVLLSPQEAAGVSVFDSLLIKRDSQVNVWRPLLATGSRMVAGTGLAAIGCDNRNFLLCVKRERLPEVERLRKELYEFLVSHGYVEAFLRWESGLLSGGTDGCPLCIEGDAAASGSTGCGFDDVVRIDGDRRTARDGEVDEFSHAGSIAD